MTMCAAASGGILSQQIERPTIPPVLMRNSIVSSPAWSKTQRSTG